MGLNRAVIKAVFKTLHTNRRWQLDFASVIRATRFKFFNKHGRLFPAACPNGRGRAHSLAHMQDCHGLDLPDPEGAFQEKIATLRGVAIKTALNSPLFPMPLDTAMQEEGELSFEENSTECSLLNRPSLGPNAMAPSLGVSPVDALEFERDE